MSRTERAELPMVGQAKDAPRLTAEQRRARALALRAWLEAPEGEPPGLGDLPQRIEDWPEDARDHFEERAAIMEVGGCLPRAEAERRAEAIVRERWRRSLLGEHEDELTDADTEADELSHPPKPR
jgi:hypothetical protein